MQLTVMITLPGLVVTTITTSTATGTGHFILVKAMRRMLKAIDAQHTGLIDATFAAAIGGLTILEHLAANGGCVALEAKFLQRCGRILAEYEFQEHIDDLLLGQRLFEHAFYCKRNVKQMVSTTQSILQHRQTLKKHDYICIYNIYIQIDMYVYIVHVYTFYQLNYNDSHSNTSQTGKPPGSLSRLITG